MGDVLRLDASGEPPPQEQQIIAVDTQQLIHEDQHYGNEQTNTPTNSCLSLIHI